MNSIFRFSFRLIVSALLFSLFMVLSQDFQIFPGVVSGLFESKERLATELPKGIRAVKLKTDDGESIEAWELKAAPQLDSPEPLAIVFHGNAETVESSLHVQKWLRSLGMSSISFDYRGYGKSSGWPSDSGIKLDTKAVLDFARNEYDLSRHPLVFVGISIGSGLAAYATTLEPAEIVLLISPYSSLKKVVADLPLFGFLQSFLWYELETEYFLKKEKWNCLILSHGLRDSTIPPKHSKELFFTLEKKGKTFLEEIKEAGHNDILLKARDLIELRLEKCLKRKVTP